MVSMVFKGTITIEWNGKGATIGFNGFAIVSGSGNHWVQWFSMVVHYWSDGGMVTCHIVEVYIVYTIRVYGEFPWREGNDLCAWVVCM